MYLNPSPDPTPRLTPVAVLSSIAVAWSSEMGTGGPSVLIWGWVICAFFTILTGLAMAELCSSMPSAGARAGAAASCSHRCGRQPARSIFLLSPPRAVALRGAAPDRPPVQGACTTGLACSRRRRRARSRVRAIEGLGVPVCLGANCVRLGAPCECHWSAGRRVVGTAESARSLCWRAAHLLSVPVWPLRVCCAC